VAEARKALDSVIEAAGSFVTKEMDINQEEGGIVIGKAGVTVQHIRSTTGIEDLQVETADDNSKKVVLKGPKEAVEVAAKMVMEVLAKAREPPAGSRDNTNGHREDKNGAKGEEGETTRSNRRSDKGEGKGREKGSGKGRDKGSKGGGESRGGKAAGADDASPASPPAGGEESKKWAEKQRKPRQPTADIQSTELFPSLGGGGAAAGKKKGPSAGAWGAAKSAEAAPAEEEPAAAAEAEADEEPKEADE